MVQGPGAPLQGAQRCRAADVPCDVDRRRLLLASVVAAGIAVTGTAALPWSRDTYDNGPFGNADAAYGWSTGAERGEVFTDGLHVLQNMGDRPVRLLGVSFEDGEPGLILAGAKVAGLDRTIGSYQQLPSFPPAAPPDVDFGPLAELEGYVIPPGKEYATRGVELLLGVRKEVDGRATRRALLITYEVDGDRKVARMVGALAVCEETRKASCPHESGKAD